MSPVEGRADPTAVQHGVEEPAVGAEAAEVNGAGGTTNVATLQPNVVKFDISAKPNPSCVVFCLELLRRAEAGEIEFCATLCGTRGGEVVNGWSSAENIRPFAIYGGLSYLAHKFASRTIEGFEG